MCIGNEHKPSKEEKKELTVGYRVFIKTSDGKLLSPYEHYNSKKDETDWIMTNFDFSVAPKGKDGYFIAQGLRSYPNDAGFYCFKSMNSVNTFIGILKELGDCTVLHGRTLVVAKVAVKGIIGIGDAHRFTCLDHLFEKGEFIRFRKMKIIELNEEFKV